MKLAFFPGNVGSGSVYFPIRFVVCFMELLFKHWKKKQMGKKEGLGGELGKMELVVFPTYRSDVSRLLDFKLVFEDI